MQPILQSHSPSVVAPSCHLPAETSGGTLPILGRLVKFVDHHKSLHRKTNEEILRILATIQRRLYKTREYMEGCPVPKWTWRFILWYRKFIQPLEPNILLSVVLWHISGVISCGIFQGVLDYLDNLTVPQIRKLYAMLSILAFRNPRSETMIQDEIHIIVRKQLTNSNTK